MPEYSARVVTANQARGAGAARGGRHGSRRPRWSSACGCRRLATPTSAPPPGRRDVAAAIRTYRGQPAQRARRHRRADPALAGERPAARHRVAARLVLAGPPASSAWAACPGTPSATRSPARSAAGPSSPGRHPIRAAPPAPAVRCPSISSTTGRPRPPWSAWPTPWPRPSGLGRLWLTSFPAGASLDTAAGTGQEVSLSGARIGPSVRLPPGYVIARATSRGLLRARAHGRGPPPTGCGTRPSAGLPDLQQRDRHRPNEIAWAPPCATALPGPGAQPGHRPDHRGHRAARQHRGQRLVEPGRPAARAAGQLQHRQRRRVAGHAAGGGSWPAAG